MNISGIASAGYPTAGYRAKKAERNVESGRAGFMENMQEKAVQEKAEQEKVVDHDEQAFEDAIKCFGGKPIIRIFWEAQWAPPFGQRSRLCTI